MADRTAGEEVRRPEEIKEVLLQTAVYAGVPAANRAFAIAQQVLAGAGADAGAKAADAGADTGANTGANTGADGATT
jgi:hypothetical protein